MAVSSYPWLDFAIGSDSKIELLFPTFRYQELPEISANETLSSLW